MKIKMFVVYDSKAEAYDKPFCLRSKGEALRGWQDVVNDGQSAISAHPGDFTLFEIGEFDLMCGELKVHEAKISLGTGLEHKRPSSSKQMDINEVIKKPVVMAQA